MECPVYFGSHGYGVLYKLSAKNKLIVLHSFDFSTGAGPVGEVVRTAKGTLFGTTADGEVRALACSANLHESGLGR